jgi:hypothetical protein
MARGKGKNSWAHNWFCKEDKCLYVAPQSGEICGVEKSKRNCIDRAAHLKAHNVTEETPLPTKQGTRNILAALAAACPPLDALEKIYVLMALHGMPNKIVNICPVWRDVTSSLISRNAVTAATATLGNKLTTCALKTFARCTLALDIGTVHCRYLAFVVIARGRALCVRLVPDDDPRVAGRFTIAAVQQVVADVIRELAESKASVVALVCDNASNLQGIVKEDLTEALGPTLPLVHRCACHVVQLIVNDCEGIWLTAYGIAQTLLKENGICGRPVGGSSDQWSNFGGPRPT